jgi:hypothetical protein
MAKDLGRKEKNLLALLLPFLEKYKGKYAYYIVQKE